MYSLETRGVFAVGEMVCDFHHCLYLTFSQEKTAVIILLSEISYTEKCGFSQKRNRSKGKRGETREDNWEERQISHTLGCGL